MGRLNFTPKTAPSLLTITTFISTYPIHHPKRHPNPINRFATIHFADRQTDRQTDRWSRRMFRNMSRLRLLCLMESDAANNCDSRTELSLTGHRETILMKWMSAPCPVHFSSVKQHSHRTKGLFTLRAILFARDEHRPTRMWRRCPMNHGITFFEGRLWYSRYPFLITLYCDTWTTHEEGNAFAIFVYWFRNAKKPPLPVEGLCLRLSHEPI